MQEIRDGLVRAQTLLVDHVKLVCYPPSAEIPGTRQESVDAVSLLKNKVTQYVGRCGFRLRREEAEDLGNYKIRFMAG